MFIHRRGLAYCLGTMSIANIIRALKDPEYRNSLSAEQRAQLPAHPAGIIDLTPAQLEAIHGGQRPQPPTGTTTCGTSTCDIQCQ